MTLPAHSADPPSPGRLLAWRRPLVVAVHVGLWALAFVGAFFLRFEFQWPALYGAKLWWWLLALLGVRLLVFQAFGGFRGLWRYAGVRDLLTLLKGTTASTLLFALVLLFAGVRGFPRSVYVIEWLGSVMMVGGLRLSIRTLRELTSQISAAGARRRVLIVGAGGAGEMLLREIQKGHGGRYVPLGFLDDDPAKIGESIHGVPVLGPVAAAAPLCAELEIDELILAIPSARGEALRQIVTRCQAADAPLRTIPAVDALIDGRVTLSHLRPVDIEDLLGRPPAELDAEAIARFVAGKRVLVTGAGGSIGSELCRQIAAYEPTSLMLVERAENALFYIHRELTAAAPGLDLRPRVADVGEGARMEALFDELEPQVVFHAAAHKHVPMMEWNPGEAVRNNVLATRRLAELAGRRRVGHFVMISTDKAVNPSSVMGASKRAAELYVQALARESETCFVTVRFGNVLGSAGSVIPIFREQIAAGGPVTVTHPEMRRYFMTISEACQLVLQAATMGAGGEIFVLDMGAPVRIVDLARDLITLSGLTPGVDVDIVFTGARPGEKLFEELATEAERSSKTRHPMIFVGEGVPPALQTLRARFDRLEAALSEQGGATAALREALRQAVPEYAPERAEPVGEGSEACAEGSAVIPFPR